MPPSCEPPVSPAGDGEVAEGVAAAGVQTVALREREFAARLHARCWRWATSRWRPGGAGEHASVHRRGAELVEVGAQH